ncbi:MAG: hypothetical protein ACRENE_16250 [Polyangiaceae bacterium]
MSTTSGRSKATALARVQALIAGTQKHFPSGSLTIGNTAYTPASIVQTLQGLADIYGRVDAAHASVKDLVAEQSATESKAAPFLRDYTKFLRGMFGTGATLLADFGLPPPKARTPLTVEQLAVRKAKAKATRAARGTTSKKQKLAVKGDVTGVVVTPVTSPPAPAAAPPVTQPVAGPAPVATTPVVTAK